LLVRPTCVIGLLVSIATAAAPSRARASTARDRNPVEEAAAAVVGDRSQKVRVQAALVLGHLHDPRATPPLIRALSDRSPTVRAVAAKELGEIGDASARAALEGARADKSPLVRRHVAAALHALAALEAGPRPGPGLDVKPMGDTTGRASPALRARMRGFVSRELNGLGSGVTGGYVVDGTIKTLSTARRSDLNLVEVKCGVQLVLSTRNGNAIVMMSSGEASVERPRRQFRPALRTGMELDALEHAVRGASDELRQHFAANVVQ
jgi:HEAT repeats